ncbi:MAG: hypothetical protein M1816_006466 [Peltula sp. TS41687]|nr:MAG: hypothetical protein M1816_006466 [Peltula sp. TS41687]
MANTTPSPRTPRSRRADASNFSTHDHHSTENFQWPRGPCHFRDLSAGQNPPRCGCQHFLIDRDVRLGDGEYGTGRNPHCGCGHKANFHEASLPGSAIGSSQTVKSPDRTVPLTSTRPVLLQLVQHPTHQSKNSGSYLKPESNLVSHQRPDGTAESSNQVRYHQNRTPSRSSRYVDDLAILPPIPPECLLSSQNLEQGDPIHELRGDISSLEYHGQYGLVRTDAMGIFSPELGIGSRAEHTSTETPMEGARTHDNLDHLAGSKGDSFAQRPQRPSMGTGRTKSSPGSSRGHISPGFPLEPAQRLVRSSAGYQNVDRRTVALQTTNLPVAARISVARQVTPSNRIPEELCLSPTEPATTPSQRGTPDLRALSGFEASFRKYQAGTGKVRQGVSVEGSRQDLSQGESSHQTPVKFSTAAPSKRVQVDEDLGKTLQQLMPCLDNLGARMAAVPGLATGFQQLGRRLEALENASTTSTPTEARIERLDLFDGRLTHVEAEVDDLDDRVRAILDDSLTVSSRRQGGVDETNATFSFTTDTSLRPGSSSVLMAAAMENAEMKNQIVELATRLSEYELLLPPSVHRPWQIEVVMIPWGPQLQGIWTMADSADGQSGTGEWTQTQGRNSAALSRANSFGEPEKYESVWDGPSIKDWAQGATNWMVPKACAMRSKVCKRLESRGLIRAVEVTGGSAKDVERAVTAEFDQVIRILNDEVASSSQEDSRSQTSHFIDEEMVMGLQAPYIPLRKVHRNPRLRFLTKNEMVSSALWTVDFLSTSVIMKGKDDQRVLFVTHRDGYTQPGNRESEWTWRRLRELPRVDLPNSTTEGGSNPVREADARETCWEWDSRLDPPISVESSFVSQASRASVLSIRNRHQPSDPAVKEEPSGTPEPVPMPEKKNLPVSPMSNYPPELRGQNQETNPQAPIVGLSARASQSKRREASRGTIATSRPLAKRRKMPPSSTNEDVSSFTNNNGLIWNATPQESQPASPFFCEGNLSGESRSQPASAGAMGNNSRKGETQFAYATPYSGPVAPFERRGRRRVKPELEEVENDDTWPGIQDDDNDDEREIGQEEDHSNDDGDGEGGSDDDHDDADEEEKEIKEGEDSGSSSSEE